MRKIQAFRPNFLVRKFAANEQLLQIFLTRKFGEKACILSGDYIYFSALWYSAAIAGKY